MMISRRRAGVGAFGCAPRVATFMTRRSWLLLLLLLLLPLLLH
jgi:hypothetical protein